MRFESEKHNAPRPTLRTIRRACANELYRALKRLKLHVPADKVKEAEAIYVRKVIGHLEWITDNRSDRSKLADWWDEAVSEDIASLWGVDRARLSRAFRDAFGG